jgi:hypothetical protein
MTVQLPDDLTNAWITNCKLQHSSSNSWVILHWKTYYVVIQNLIIIKNKTCGLYHLTYSLSIPPIYLMYRSSHSHLARFFIQSVVRIFCAFSPFPSSKTPNLITAKVWHYPHHNNLGTKLPVSGCHIDWNCNFHLLVGRPYHLLLFGYQWIFFLLHNL